MSQNHEVRTKAAEVRSPGEEGKLGRGPQLPLGQCLQEDLEILAKKSVHVSVVWYSPEKTAQTWV